MGETLGTILNLLWTVLLFPVRVLLWPFGFLRNRLPEDDAYSSGSSGFVQTLGRWLKAGLGFVIQLPLLLVKAPIVFVRSLFSAGWRELLFLLPAILMVCFLGYVFFGVWSGETEIEDRYRIGAFKAIKDGDYDLAKTNFTRIIDAGELQTSDELAWAGVLSLTGETDRALEILNKLAPDKGPPGYRPAHREKVANLLRTLGKTSDPDHLSKLKRHLDCCEKDVPELSRAWFTYYLAIGDSSNAMQKLVVSSEKEPQYWLGLAELYKRQGNETSQIRCLDAAKESSDLKVKKDPFDIQARVNLAKTLTRQEDIDGAERVLVEGLKLMPNEQMKRLLCDFYLLRFDKSSLENEEFAKQFAYLQNALSLSAGNAGIYDRMTKMFLAASTEEKKLEIRNELLNLVTGDKPSAMAHFALGNLYESEGDSKKAVWHLKQSYELDNRSLAVANNLAWMLAHGQEPDLDQALELANNVLKVAPGNPEFLDTLGSIYLKRGEYESAIVSFEKSLPRVLDKAAVHKKLAICYRAIDRPELAKLHEKNEE